MAIKIVLSSDLSLNDVIYFIENNKDIIKDIEFIKE